MCFPNSHFFAWRPLKTLYFKRWRGYSFPPILSHCRRLKPYIYPILTLRSNNLNLTWNKKSPFPNYNFYINKGWGGVFRIVKQKTEYFFFLLNLLFLMIFTGNQRQNFILKHGEKRLICFQTVYFCIFLLISYFYLHS